MSSLFLRRLLYMLVVVSMLSPLNIFVTGDKPESVEDVSIEFVGYTPLNPENGDIVFFTACISNRGLVNIENLDILFLYDNNKIDVKDISLLKVNESFNVSVNWKAISGNHTITMIVDPENRIPEVNESNNIRPFA